jgi:phage gpG-like protein
VKLRFDQRGFDTARRELHDMRIRVQDVRPAWDVVLTWWAERNVTNFRNAGKRWQAAWRPLAPTTLAEKLRLGYPPNILVRSGDLRTSLTMRPLGVEQLRPHDVEAGTNVPYADFHQRGTKRMPQRKLVNARAVQQEGVVTNALINWIVDGKKSTRSRKIERVN